MALLSVCFLVGCHEKIDKAKADISMAHDLIKNQLRDSSSAEFRNERVRTLWSVEGSRLKVYCAEVNANNAFGGKAGYQPVEVTLEEIDSPKQPKANVLLVPNVEIHDRVTSDHFQHCVRADMQRSDSDIFMTYLDAGTLDVGAIYRESPVISLNGAPELRN